MMIGIIQSRMSGTNSNQWNPIGVVHAPFSIRLMDHLHDCAVCSLWAGGGVCLYHTALYKQRVQMVYQDALLWLNRSQNMLREQPLHLLVHAARSIVDTGDHRHQIKLWEHGDLVAPIARHEIGAVPSF